jgi:hypothetical protein
VTPQQLRAYVLIVMRDILPPLVGAFLSIYLAVSGRFEYWQLPLLAGLFGVPLVRGSSDVPEDARGDGRPGVGSSQPEQPSLPSSSSERGS